jgi:hypothetical protein
MASIPTLSMADTGVEGKGKQATGGYDILAKITINGGKANRVDARGKMRYKPLASPSWRPRWRVGDVPLLLSP